MIKTFSIILLSLIVYVASAQHLKNCGTDERNALFHNHDQTKNEYEPYTKLRRNEIIKIPVVIHIVYNTSSQNISEEEIKSQIDVLNEDFRMQNSDITNVRWMFKDLVADAGFEFCLAAVDPDSHATNGITRTKTSVNGFYAFQDKMMDTLTGGINPWPTDKYLNIWVCNMDRTGYAIFPWNRTAHKDGVVIHYANFGRLNPQSSRFNLGRICTHEVAHYLGLYHTFQDGCKGGDSLRCNKAGDRVCDTPPQITWINSCEDTALHSCEAFTKDTIAMYENFLDYANDACRVMFTQGQVERMHFQFNRYRSSLLNSNICNISSSVYDMKSDNIFEIYPNPTTTSFNIQFLNNDYYDVKIYNTYGQLLESNFNVSKKIQFDAKEYKNGVYIVSIKDHLGKTYIKKLIIN